MKRLTFLSRATVMCLGTSLALAPRPAAALERLTEFLAGAKTANFDARELRAVTEQRAWERDAALGRLLPALSARGVYTFNQYEAAVTLPGGPGPIVITPQNQLDAYFQADVPVLDIAGHHRVAQATHVRKASEEQQALTASQVETGVAQSYFVLIGAAALVQAAAKSLEVAESNANFISTRANFGAATSLDSERARANVEQARQQLVDATLARDLQARQLETLSGITPSPVDAAPEVLLTPPLPLEKWLETQSTPADRVQAELTQAAVYGRKAAKSAFLPTINVTANERLTNAAGFVGQSNIFTLQAVLAIRLDYTQYATTKAQAASADAQVVRAEKTRRTTSDAIFQAWQRVTSGITKCQSTRAQAEASRKASALADERFRAGAATELDVTQAQRDAFDAEVSRVRADLDLALARVQLITVSGQSLTPYLDSLEHNWVPLDKELQGAASDPRVTTVEPTSPPSAPETAPTLPATSPESATP